MGAGSASVQSSAIAIPLSVSGPMQKARSTSSQSEAWVKGPSGSGSGDRPSTTSDGSSLQADYSHHQSPGAESVELW